MVQGTLNIRKLQRAENHLAQIDVVMARLILENGPCSLATRKVGPFHTLVTSIISQQLSSQAADTIEARIAKIVSRPFKPESFLQIPTSRLCSAGLSRAKARYIQDLAKHVSSDHLSFSELALLDDETVITSLMELKGIGRWTAEMFLIFGLKRADVLSLTDAGLQRAAKLLYGNGHHKNNLLANVGAAWRPYRSVASWYLWRYLDTIR